MIRLFGITDKKKVSIIVKKANVWGCQNGV